MEELKEIMNTCKDFFFAGLKAANSCKNEEDEEKDKDDKAKNEDVDKRELIRKIAAITGKEEDSEDVRTIIKLAEKLAYDKSSTGTAGNKAKNEDGKDKEDKEKDDEAKNKCKNEDGKEKEGKETEYEDFKEKVKEEAENKKASNSLDDLTKQFYQGGNKKEKFYMSQKEGIELGKKLY